MTITARQLMCTLATLAIAASICAKAPCQVRRQGGYKVVPNLASLHRLHGKHVFFRVD
jgi:hypothetical protein